MSQGWRYTTDDTFVQMPSKENPPIYIKYDDIGEFQRREKAKVTNGKISAKEKAILDNEWADMVEKAHEDFKKDLVCGRCSEKHYDSETKDPLDDLRREMEQVLGHRVTEADVDGFQETFEKIWDGYLEKVGGSRCTGI